MSTKKLTDTQRVVLSHAAMQLDGALLPVPHSIRLNAGAVNIVLRSLLTQGLVFERTAARDQVAWRQEENGDRVKLVISDAGCGAIGVDPIGTGSAGDGSGVRRDNQSESAASIRMRTLALLIAALEKAEGATIPDLMEATGWQAHSIRGAIAAP